MNELIKGIKELNKAIRYKLSKKYCPNQAPMSPSVVEILEKQVVLNDSLIKQLANVEYNRKVIKVPQFVAEYLKKGNEDEQIAALIYQKFLGVMNTMENGDLKEWLRGQSFETLLALKIGYEVEEEPKYYIKVGDKLYFKNWGEDGTCPVFEIDDVPGGVTGITAVDLQEAEMTAGIIGGTVEEVGQSWIKM
ncbi:DUF1642 domain-containing protein [Vagococcus sp. BWB3-3]|uniref:DUF1642 domain-containing protein n=1 Tax=Vagococcus allomyrinae TaxID=2794353 RepID=A0A940P2Q9_9ENTE|nr:DUF1642 domain-containing protein [Vagococcus allomyrinae]MBP1040384.1 DUF1642 domain-containing protein [Vagococcus allomyrinae]